MSGLWVKICGITNPVDAEMCVAAGADAIGINFAPVSPRRVSFEAAKLISGAVRGRIELVGVFVDAAEEQLTGYSRSLRLDRVQLHGHETPASLESLSVPAYKAVPIGGRADVEAARLFAGDRLLVDAKVDGALGGTGKTFDWTLIEALVRERKVVLAGGLRADNVGAAVASVRPFGVDTASGVEERVGKKDENLVRQFVKAARQAA